MLKPFILRSVSKPAKIILACPEATVLSICTSIMLCVFLQDVLIGLWSFLILQPLMAFLTYKDPYFIKVWMGYFRCRKTKNYYPVKGNRYEP